MEEKLTIGKLLKDARKRKDVSLEDVANKTKININILRSLEKDDLEMLPNKTYVKGFVKNCAKTLGIDKDEALKALDNVYQQNEPEAAQPEDAEERQISETPSNDSQESKKSMDKQLEIVEMQERLRGILGQLFNKKVMLAAVGLVVAVLVVKGVIGFFSSISEEKDSLARTEEALKNQNEGIKPSDSSLFELENAKKIAEGQNNKADGKKGEKSEISSSQEAPAPIVEDEAEVKDEEGDEQDNNETETASDAEVEKPQLPPGKFSYVNFYPAPRNLFTLKADAEEIQNNEVFPEKYKNSMDPEKHNLFVNAVEGDTWLSYQVDGGDIKRYVLRKGRSLFLQADEVILLFMGNLNATKIFYNNQLVEAQTRTGVKSLIFPEAKSADYDLPLFPTHNGVPRKQDIYKKNMVEKSDA